MKFNKKVESLEQRLMNRSDATRNYEGGLAFKMSPEVELFTRVASCFVAEPRFYASGTTMDKELTNLIRKVGKINPRYILSLASYSRNVLNLRSVSIKLLVEAANINECKPFVRQYTPKIVRRADELTEAMAYQLNVFGKPIPNSLKKGLADALKQFDEYQLNKYNRTDQEITLKDVIKLIHPSPQNSYQEALWYKYLVGGEVSEELQKICALKELAKCEELNEKAIALAEKAHATWEVLLPVFGSKREVWELLASGRTNMPYMAKLRNLKNFLKHDVDITPVISHLTNDNAIKHSKQLPFRFYSAFKEIKIETGEYTRSFFWRPQTNHSLRNANPVKVAQVLDALNIALEKSLQNVPLISGTTFMTADNSGSMERGVSSNSSIQLFEIADLMMALAAKAWSKCGDVITSVFATQFQVVPFAKTDSIITNMERFKNTDVGSATNAYLAVKWLRENNIKVDRIMVFSDTQCYEIAKRRGGLAYQVELYRQQINPDVYVYSFDIAGYGTAMFPENAKNTCLLGGFSEKIFEFIPMFESNPESIVEKIKREW